MCRLSAQALDPATGGTGFIRKPRGAIGQRVADVFLTVGLRKWCTAWHEQLIGGLAALAALISSSFGICFEFRFWADSCAHEIWAFKVDDIREEVLYPELVKTARDLGCKRVWKEGECSTWCNVRCRISNDWSSSVGRRLTFGDARAPN